MSTTHCATKLMNIFPSFSTNEEKLNLSLILQQHTRRSSSKMANVLCDTIGKWLKFSHMQLYCIHLLYMTAVYWKWLPMRYVYTNTLDFFVSDRRSTHLVNLRWCFVVARFRPSTLGLLCPCWHSALQTHDQNMRSGRILQTPRFWFVLARGVSMEIRCWSFNFWNISSYMNRNSLWFLFLDFEKVYYMRWKDGKTKKECKI